MENRITEQASAYDNLQRMSVHDILTGINREDARVHEAVAKTIPVMERLVERVVERMERGGRMFYIGAGTSGRLGVTDASELPPTYGVPFDRVIGLIAGGDGALRRAVENAEDDTAGAWRDMAPYHPTADDVLVGIAAYSLVLALTLGLIPFQLVLNESDEELPLSHVVALQVALDPLKQFLRHLKRHRAHINHVLFLLVLVFGV